ncbi:MAG: dihydroxyacetone kinase subunit L [Eubacteriales bacterium]
MDKITSNDIMVIFQKIYDKMCENKEYLIELDSKAGDGDLGISMCQGFKGVLDELASLDVQSIEPRKLVLKAAMAINEHSPSSLGTILSAGMMGGSKVISGKDSLGVAEYRDFVNGAFEGICSRAGSKRGEKTILDAIGGAMDALNECADSGVSLKEAAQRAAQGAYEGMQKTKEMMAVHGRAAYYQEKTIGNVDGGATVGMLIFKAIEECISE